MSLNRILAEYAINTPSDAVTPAALDACKKLVLDTIGVSIAAWNAPGISQVHDLMNQWGGRGEASVLVYGTKFPGPDAVFTNSAMAHALDYDDLHDPSALHISSVVLPVVLAAGQIAGVSGKDVLAAMVLGIETAARIGIPYNHRRQGVQGRGFLPTSVIGGFGAAWAASRLLKQSIEQAVNAAGINYAQASGNRQALFEKTLTKRLQPAFAARNAFWAACLAGNGITGPEACFEGEAGVFRVYINAEPPKPEDVMKKRDYFEIERNTIKRFTSCGLAHPLTQAALDLAKEHRFKREDIQEVAIYSHGGPDGENLTGGPFKMGNNPQVNAQFCNAYGVAVGLLRGKAGLAEFTNEQVLKDTEVAEFAQQIKILTELADIPKVKRIEDDFPPHVDKPHVLVVKTRDGRELRKMYTIREILSPKRMSMDDTVEKFYECTRFSGVCSDDKAHKIISMVLKLDHLANISELLDICTLVK
ncbi:MAG: MmgE/PrpD family protein [Sedimentisphaerales bacterium]|nr:MmgE/PrpD family protein [Sedimentisphaerales bacterium]